MATEAAESSSTPWDTSTGNRFAHYSSEDHSAPLWIAAILSFTYVLGMLLVRTFLKWRVFGWDDFLVVFSTVFSSVQSMLIFRALNSGLGKVPVRATDVVLAGKLVFTSRILFVISLYLAKLSILFLLRRIFIRDQKIIALLCYTVIGLTIIGGFGSVLAVSVGCPTSTFFAEHCHGQITKWTAVIAIDLVTEGLTFLLPIYMVWQLQMKFKTKLRVITAFCFRLIVIALCAIHLRVWMRYTKGAPSPIDIVTTLVWQQVLLTTSLVAATIPNLKAFLQSLSASWGGAQFGYTTKAYGNGTFEMNNMSNTTPQSAQNAVDGKHSLRSRPGFGVQITTSGPLPGKRSSLDSGESQDLIIRKETTWTVERSWAST